MKMKLQITVLCLFLSSFVFGQISIDQIQIRQGPLLKRNFKLNFVYQTPLGASLGNMFGLFVPYGQVMESSTGTDKYKLFRVTDELNQGPYQTMEPEQGGMDTEYEFVLMIKDQLWLFVSFKNQKLNKTFLLSRPININTLKPEGELKPVCEVDYSRFSKYRTTKFNYEFSPDSSKILINYNLIDNDYSILSSGFSIIDFKMDVLWTMENTLPAASQNKVYVFNQLLVNNNSEVFLLCKIFNTTKQYKKARVYYFQKPDYTYVLFTYRDKGKKNNEYILDLPGRFIINLRAGLPPEGGLICAGLTGDSESMSVNGACSFFLEDNIDAEIVKHDRLIPLEIILKGHNEIAIEKINKKISENEEFEQFVYVSKPLLFSEDGHVWLTSEQQSKGKSDATINHNHSVYVIAFRHDGEIVFMNKLFKLQYSRSLDVLLAGFHPFIHNNNLCILYNNLPTNTNSIKLKKTSLLVTQFELNGNESTRSLSDYTLSKVTVCPGYAQRNGNDKISLFGYHGGIKYRFLEVSF